MRDNKTHKNEDWGLKKFKKGEADHEEYGPDQNHNLAFLVPVPIYYGYGCPSGIPSGPGGGCAAVSIRLSSGQFRSLIVWYRVVAEEGFRLEVAPHRGGDAVGPVVVTVADVEEGMDMVVTTVVTVCTMTAVRTEVVGAELEGDAEEDVGVGEDAVSIPSFLDGLTMS